MTDTEQDPTPIPEAPNLTIPWPTVRPTGVTVTADGLKEAWDAIVPSFGQNGQITQSIEERVVMGVLRAVYDGMHGLTRDDAPATSPATRETVTEEMVERAARVIYERRHAYPEWGALGGAREMYRAHARAALEAALTKKGAA